MESAPRHQEMQTRALDQQTRQTVVSAFRGTIYDRNGSQLAVLKKQTAGQNLKLQTNIFQTRHITAIPISTGFPRQSLIF